MRGIAEGERIRLVRSEERNDIATADAEAVELTLDVMRNASNKIAVALGGDAPRVEQGTEQYLLDADGQTVFS